MDVKHSLLLRGQNIEMHGNTSQEISRALVPTYVEKYNVTQRGIW